MSAGSHRCTICGQVGEWSPAWSWFGSYKQLDDGQPVVKVCNDACRSGLSAVDLGRFGKALRSDPAFVARPAA